MLSGEIAIKNNHHYYYYYVDGSNPAINILCSLARHFIHIASFDSAAKRVPGGEKLMKGVQCY